MANWVRQPVSFLTDDPDTGRISAGPVFTSQRGERLGYLAIVPVFWHGERRADGSPVVYFDGRLVPDAWGIVHIPTRVLFAFSMSQDKARAYCERAEAELGDWWDFTWHRFPRGKEETRRRVYATTDWGTREGLFYRPGDL
ncbi:MAG: hypothetical protein L0332_06740 [Chloroflexi bacterium]|nr:hypothetical protein [Chloroflexota bacterium]